MMFFQINMKESAAQCHRCIMWSNINCKEKHQTRCQTSTGLRSITLFFFQCRFSNDCAANGKRKVCGKTVVLENKW